MRLTIVYGQEDWYGLYIDGVLCDEGHSPDVWRVLSLIADARVMIVELTRFTLDDAQDLALNTRGRMPRTLAELEAWKAAPMTPIEKGRGV